MKAVIIEKPFESRVVDLPVPRPQGDQVLIRVTLSGICASDVMAFRGEHPYRVPPVVTGHEVVGEVREVGSAVRGVAVGDRVVVEPHIGCGRCSFCLAGGYNLCPSKAVLGTQAWPGGFAEYVVVPERCVVKLPDDVSWEAAVLIEPLAVGVHAAGRVPVGPSSKVGVLGAGPIGLATLLALARFRPGLLLATDVRQSNLELASDLGATMVVNPAAEDLDRLVRAKAPEGLDVVFVTTTAESAVQSAFKLARRKGTMVVVATFGRALLVDLSEVQLYERSLVGTAMYTRQDFAESISLVQSSPNAPCLLTDTVFLEELPGVLTKMSKGERGDTIKAAISFIQ